MAVKKVLNPFYLGKKVIIKVLLIPAVKRGIGRISQFYEGERIERERSWFKQEAYALNFAHYLPHTEERIERLRRLVSKRPVAIILHGPSVKELEQRINELRDCDICYFGLNAFRIPEQNILEKINRKYSLVMCSDPVELYEQVKNGNLVDFLERSEDNMLISERAAFHNPPVTSLGLDVDYFIRQYDRKLLFFTTTFTSIAIREELFLQAPSLEYPLHFPRQSSFSILLPMALIGEAPFVVVFGADGGRISGQELYFRETGSSEAFKETGVTGSLREWRLMMDTKMFNLTMPLVLEKIYQMYNLRSVDIVNCSLHSHYTPLRKLSYDDTFALLRSFKKIPAEDVSATRPRDTSF